MDDFSTTAARGDRLVYWRDVERVVQSGVKRAAIFDHARKLANSGAVRLHLRRADEKTLEYLMVKR